MTASHDPKPIRLLCLDVDGVLTDGGIRIDDNGVETKRFHVRDGAGMRIWLRLGHDIAIITGRTGEAVKHRARELGIKHLIQGSQNKAEAFDALLRELGLEPHQAAMLGDDLPDLPVMRRCGYPMAVADAVEQVQTAAAFVTTHRGGNAAVREAIEHLLSARNEWSQALAFFE